MSLYAESSAVLSWLLGEAAGSRVRDALRAADLVITSDLTLVECERVLIRAAKVGELAETEAADCSARLNAVAADWHVLEIGPDVVLRTRQAFPGEPIRTLDGLHLASALVARSAVAGLEFLSLDERIRGAAHRLGFALQPA